MLAAGVSLAPCAAVQSVGNFESGDEGLTISCLQYLLVISNSALHAPHAVPIIRNFVAKSLATPDELCFETLILAKDSLLVTVLYFPHRIVNREGLSACSFSFFSLSSPPKT